MLGAALRRALWLLLHAIYAAIVVVNQLTERWRCHLQAYRRARRLQSESALPVKGARPLHVAFLVCERQHSYPDLAHVLLWSLAAGVQHFTFYDRNGLLKKNEDKLYAAVETLKVNVPGQIKWTNRPNINGYKNGTSRKITVNIFSSDDGKQRVVSLTRDMCSVDRVTNVDPDSVSVESFDRRLSDLYPLMPEPNIAIYCGKSCCPDGFLPWHIRLTEFFSLGSDHSVRLEKYVQLLETYARCEQRFGK